MTTFGISEMSRADYDADTWTDGPSLNSTTARLLCTASPLHAWTQHPKLNPDYRRKDEEKFDIGTAAHAALLQGLEVAVSLPYDSWRTKDSQEARAAARSARLVPLLERDYERMQAMVLAAADQIGSHGASPPLLADGKPERTLIWHEPDGTGCRARLDWLRDDHRAIDDYKTTTRSANPEQWARNLFAYGYDIQAAFYLRGLERLTGVRAEYRLIVQECEPPYALSVVGLSEPVLTIARKKVDYALSVWEKCLRENAWPGYSTEVAYAELPAWEEARWLAKEDREWEAAA